jgi:hypothetical protein
LETYFPWKRVFSMDTYFPRKNIFHLLTQLAAVCRNCVIWIFKVLGHRPLARGPSSCITRATATFIK